MSVQFPQSDRPQQNSPYTAPQAPMVYDDEVLYYDDTPFYKASGRIGRVRYLAYTMLFGIMQAIGYIILVILAAILIPMSENLVYVLIIPFLALMAVGIYASFAPAIRRLNDLGHSGWLSLLLFAPLVNIALYLYLIFARGEEGVNQYGSPAEPPSTLMTVLAVMLPVGFALIGILAAIAIPAYQDYVMRAGL